MQGIIKQQPGFQSVAYVQTDAGIRTGKTLDKCKLTEKIDYFDWIPTSYEIYIISFKVYVRLLSQPSFHKRIIEPPECR